MIDINSLSYGDRIWWNGIYNSRDEPLFYDAEAMPIQLFYRGETVVRDRGCFFDPRSRTQSDLFFLFLWSEEIYATKEEAEIAMKKL